MSGPAHKWLMDQELLVKEEFYTPWGICDFVGISFSKKRVRERLRLGQRDPIGPPERIAVLNQIPDTESQMCVTPNDLAICFSDVFLECELQKELDRLIEKRFVIRNESGGLQRLNGWAPLHKRIVAMELKLRRVQEALFQATSHLKFATESYVGLPEESARSVLRSKSIQDFERSGVGLVAIGASKCRVLVRSHSVPLRADPALQMHCTERFWRTHIRGN